jgi:hypothetical protein
LNHYVLATRKSGKDASTTVGHGGVEYDLVVNIDITLIANPIIVSRKNNYGSGSG